MFAMLYGKRIALVLPACNAARTLEKTVSEVPKDIVDTVLQSAENTSRTLPGVPFRTPT